MAWHASERERERAWVQDHACLCRGVSLAWTMMFPRVRLSHTRNYSLKVDCVGCCVERRLASQKSRPKKSRSRAGRKQFISRWHRISKEHFTLHTPKVVHWTFACPETQVQSCSSRGKQSSRRNTRAQSQNALIYSCTKHTSRNEACSRFGGFKPPRPMPYPITRHT